MHCNALQFDELQTCSGDDAPLRRPPCDSLLDVFMNIRDDEVEHVKTMHACQVGSLKLSRVSLKLSRVNTMRVKTMHACQVSFLKS
jgi:hypothetical protein